MSCKMGRLAIVLGFLCGSLGLHAQFLAPTGSALEPVGATHGAGSGDPEILACLKGASMLLTASPQTVLLGQSSNLSWSVDLPDGCESLTLKLDGNKVATSGNRVVQPSVNTWFNLVLNTGPRGGFAQRMVSREVVVGYPNPVIIDEATPDPVGTLLGALSPWNPNPEQTVELCHVDLDLTGHSDIEIGGVGQKRALIASPGCERGARSFGSRIFVTEKRNSGTPLFVIKESNVRISGFRLQGPMPDVEWDDSHQEIGIDVAPFASPALMSNGEISNMEISNWSGAGIKVNDNDDGAERGRLTNENVRAVHIQNNYLHHNRHIGEGYGVVISAGAYALIEQNVFEANRHAIAGTSNGSPKDYPGYTARDNLILPGGGLACSTKDVFGVQIILGCWQTHQIDMHGDTSTTLGGEWCCRNAGETMIIQRNTILYTGGETPYALELGLTNGPVPVWTDGYAIKIRGNPVDKAVVDGNVFKHANRGDAISQNGDGGYGDNITNPIQVLPNNVFGADPSAENHHFCDFAGDGQLDEFMATGVTWWAKSPVTHQWRYLNTMPQRLSDIHLGTFDNDAVCDVAPPTDNPFHHPKVYSKSGTGPWVPFLVNAQ